jgi:oligoribonuclease NrnB/cAMP/cGMP phosphodiesterase (DHH superfamily)
MMASRGMGAINPSKMPGGKKKPRRDNTDFTQYAGGGHVNAAGNYTKPELRKRIVAQVKAAATQGTGAGQWSARKAQLVAKRYKAAGGGYRD